MDDSEPMQIDVIDDVNDNNDNEGRSGSISGHSVGGGGGGGRGDEDPMDFVVENPTLDLETYANSYTGLAKLLRLIHIADHCPTLRVEALKMAIAQVKKTMNVGMYKHLYKNLRGVGNLEELNNAAQASSSSGGGAGGSQRFPSPPDVAAVPDPVSNGGGESASTSSSTNGAGGSGQGGGGGGGDFPPVDTLWIEATTKRSAIMLDRLDAELKNHKANSIKESIRRGFDDMGEFYLECGDLLNALKSFTRSRDYCTSPKHVVHMCINIIKVSIYLNNWPHVMNYVMKAESTPDPSTEDKKSTKESGQILAKLKCASGLADLSQKKYKAAAKSFLGINIDHFDCPDFISQNNVAVYAALCALATFDRKELKEQVISSSSFKLFLELEPQIREVLTCFYESKYAKCLALLDEMRDNFMLDLYLAPHVRTLYAHIRSRGLVQYFAPYQTADMTKMAQSFNTSVNQLENEIMELILAGDIAARIDSHNKIIHMKNSDERSLIFEKAVKLGEEYERRTKLMILRSAMLRAHLQVKNPREKEDPEYPEGGRRMLSRMQFLGGSSQK